MTKPIVPEFKSENMPDPRTGIRLGPYNGVRVTHIATGISAECDSESSQHKNRDMAIAEIRKRIKTQENPPMTKTIACPECKGYNLSMQTNPVHDPVHHYECHDCGHSWDVQPNKGIVLTEEERAALVCAQKLMEKAAYLHECQGAEQASVLVRHAKTLENLLARAGGEGEPNDR